MRLLILSFSMLMLAAPALAADENVIRVINEDGSVTVFEIPKAAEPPPAEKTEIPKPTEEVQEEVQEEKQVETPAAEPSSEPAPEVKKVSAGKAPDKPAKKAAKKKNAAKVKEARAVPPSPPARLPPRVIPPGTVITEELATSIALDNMPPASSLDVVQRTYNGKLVYVVMFKTDYGPRDVLVDAQTGDIVLVK